ncbi:MAG TPA: outer membrane beta-barrel protein, partial [Burkholderiaceae bacterium]|nr:outer membrane beta-barrel protein [Burkholderiaceae bacterium]
TPPLQNNSSIYNVYLSHTSGPFTVIPTLQYANVPTDAVNQVTQGALSKSLNTFGGGLYGIYAMDGGYSVAGRVEYISTSGDKGDAASLLYGGGSDAWSFTITPTWQNKFFFARAEFSYTKISSGTPGFMLGPTFSSDSMTRVMLETGVIF